MCKVRVIHENESVIATNKANGYHSNVNLLDSYLSCKFFN